MDKKKTFAHLIKRYSICFIVFFCICIVPFLCARGYGLFDLGDGLHQQLNYFIYSGRWIRQLCNNLFVEHIPELPMWDMSIGMGGDPLITFLWGNEQGPLSVISAFIPLKYAEIAFDVLIVFRLYLAGLSYSIYAYYREKKENSILAGSMVYCFSAVLYISFLQPGFLVVFILFPILFIGVDRLWTGKGHLLYVIVLAFSMIFSFYFTFMFSILIIVYCVLRYFTEGNRSVKKLITLISRFMFFSIIAVCIGMLFAYPVIMNTAKLDRMNRYFDVSFFSVENMILIFSQAFSFAYMGGDSIFGLSAVAVIGLLCLFEKKDNKLLKKLFVIYTLSFLFPIIGAVFHLMKYSTSRYAFGYNFLFAYIVTCSFDSFSKIKRKHLYCLWAGVMIYAPIACVLGGKSGVFSAATLVITILAFTLTDLMMRRKVLEANFWYMIPIAVSCIMVSASCFLDSSVFSMIKFGSAYTENYVIPDKSGLDENELKNVRYSMILNTFDETPTNVSMNCGLNGYDYYNSYCNVYLSEFNYDMGVNCSALGFSMTGFRGRAFLDIPNSTKYIIRDNQNTTCVAAPYGYELISTNDNIEIYQSIKDVSLVYFYDNAVSRAYYDTCSPIDREELIMKACILDDAGSAIDQSQFHNLCEYTISTSDSISMSGNEIMVDSSSGYVELDFDEASNCEISVLLDGLVGDREADGFFLVGVVKCSDGSAVTADYFTGLQPMNIYYSGKDDILFNLGYCNDPINSVRIYFFTPGKFTIDDIQIYTRSEEQLNSGVDRFYENACIDDITYEYSGNHISILADADRDKYLYLAVPYSEGWSATVDGEDVEIIRANEAFMAIRIAPGVHNIELKYTTPYLKTGMAVSLISIGVLCIFEVVTRIIKKNTAEAGPNDGNQGE